MSCVTIAQIFIPQDIMSVIFCMLKDSNRHYASSWSKFDSSLQWVPEVTHVSHSWREIALSNKSLWTDINVEASTSWAVEFARRSGQAPIRISLNLLVFRISPHKCTKTLLHENMQRIREINLKNVDAEDILLAAGSDDNELQLFPFLESLTIAFDRRPRSPFLLTNRNMFAPKLKRLSLEGCPIGEDFGSFRNLSHLSVSNDGPLSTTTMFLRIALSEMSNLERLKHTVNALWMSISPAASPVDFGNQVITLPKLRKLDINGWPIESAISILQAISHGPLRSVSVDGCPADRLDQVLHLFNCISPHAIENQNVDRLHLAINLEYVEQLRIRCEMGRDFIGGANLLNIGSPSEIDNFSLCLLEGVLHMINYQYLKHLELHLPYPLSTLLWVEYFGQLRLLTSIGTSGEEKNLFTALMNGLSEDVNNVTTMTPSFPALKELKIGVEKDLFSEEEIELMLQCLRKRLDLGIGLKKLCFSVDQPGAYILDENYGWDELQENLREDLREQLVVFRDVVESMDIFWVQLDSFTSIL